MVYLLIDCSGSMGGTALEQAKAGALRFAAEARSGGYRVGLIRFSDGAIALKNPDTGFTKAVQSLTADGGTNLTAGLELGIEKLLNEATDKRVMCVVTDGAPNDEGTALSCAQRAARYGISIMAIGTAGANQAFLDKLATTAHLGKHVAADKFEEGISDMARLLPPPHM